ncbi:site-specific integrase [Thermomonas fusca]|uniref:site-specific integrase n=1 Tax=Thermomonas fusca TaxID=215690 RepID=UPI00146C92A5|nr:site-specific integrase [Thermomonas fusca]
METGSELIAVDSDLPDGVTVADVVRSDGLVAPAIWSSRAGEVEVHQEALAWALSELSFERSYAQVLQFIRSVSGLMKFYSQIGSPSLDGIGLRKLVQDYILARHRGDDDLNWKPLARDGLKAQVRHIVAFSDFCQREFGYLPLLGKSTVPLPPPSRSQKSFWKLMACNETDFFSHLAIRRESPVIDIRIPGRARTKGGAKGFSGMSEEVAWNLIDAEQNDTFKAIWLLGFFGGPRLSESLNLWICDVLPGNYRTTFFPGDIFADLPLVVIANPWTSRWCGKIGEERTTRSDFLKNTFGLVPRPQMAESDNGINRGKTAGFKGIRQTNDTGEMRQIFWASERAAREFESLIVRVIQKRSRMPLARRHPFLFVNTDPRRPEIQGDMLAMSNVKKAFVRAVNRIGEIPFRSRRSPHGMRHFYSDLIRRLVGGDVGSVQVCLGQRSRLSQHDYGTLDMAAMRHALAAGTRN